MGPQPTETWTQVTSLSAGIPSRAQSAPRGPAPEPPLLRDCQTQPCSGSEQQHVPKAREGRTANVLLWGREPYAGQGCRVAGVCFWHLLILPQPLKRSITHWHAQVCPGGGPSGSATLGNQQVFLTCWYPHRVESMELCPSGSRQPALPQLSKEGVERTLTEHGPCFSFVCPVLRPGPCLERVVRVGHMTGTVQVRPMVTCPSGTGDLTRLA